MSTRMINEEETRDLREHLAAFRRRWKPILATGIILFLISAAVAALLPATYRSTATILIEQQEMPADLVRSTISSYADQRIQVISQQVMTRVNLMRIVEQYNLYPGSRATRANEELVQRLAKDIKLDLLKADVIDQRGSKTNATIAFSLSYEGETPAVAQKVTNELVTLFLSENLKNRQQKSAETSAFLAEEAAKLGAHVSETEAKLATFKERNTGRLPELVQLNMQLRDRTDSEIKELDRQISQLEERKFYMESQLTQMKPNSPLISASGERIQDSGERLKTLKTVFASLSAVYSSDHPDIVKMRREIEALQKATGGGADPQEQAQQLARLRAALVTTRDKFSDDHPDVVKLKKFIAALEAEQPMVGGGKAAAVRPENPTYIAFQTQIEAINIELKHSRSKRDALQSKLASYDQRLQQTPQVEREYLDLTRDHEASLQRYREIRAKQMQADIGEELEKDRKAERFSLIDPPQLPERPSSPNRTAILLLGLVLSVGGGVGSAAVLEGLDDSVHGSRALAGLVDVPVLAVIPSMVNEAQIQRRRKVLRIAAVSAVAALGLAVLLVHFFVMPLDVLWFRALRSLERYVPAATSLLQSPSGMTRMVWSA